ncbi:MAG: carboxymuconolactone decarboxylase family protein [Sneathiellaceae bacterium]
MDKDMHDKGLSVRRAVLGDSYVDRALDNADSFSQPLQDLLNEYCWGAVWGREGLSRKQRSLNNLCMLAALNRSEEFKTHFRGALRNGCTLTELQETLLQIAIYCGVPASVEAFRNAREVLKAEGIAPDAIDHGSPVEMG